MATQQPNMDALNKVARKRKANHPHANPHMNKKIASLHRRWQKLWIRSSERHRQLLEARTRMKDIALARSFNFDNWKKRFTSWVDQQKLRVNDLFRRFDSNHDGMLTREEFMKALKASGMYSMNVLAPCSNKSPPPWSIFLSFKIKDHINDVKGTYSLKP